ncbi:MAG: hypothetical protein BGO76_01340 [Caedibacter sp. 38-128]|nr:hypothetical protein [Holosporales bacterium]OJX05464.1 MAG: hypothetical protein BGO76_01340 [Caedibacter sp. 38-128]
MLKLICYHFILIGFFALSSLSCFGSDATEEFSSSLKRPRSSSQGSTSEQISSRPHKRQKIATTCLTFTVPQQEEAILRLVHYVRIRDGLAFISTCRSFASLLHEDRLWKEYIHRIPGHYAFISEKTKKNGEGFYKALFKQLLRPHFFPLLTQSKAIYSEIHTLSSLNLSVWGSVTRPPFEDEQESSSDDTQRSNSQATIETNLTDSEESDFSEDYDHVFEQAAIWQEGIFNFVPTQEEALGSCILGVSADDKVLVGLYNPEISPSDFKAASWTLKSSGSYEMNSLPDENAQESIARALNNDGSKIVGNLYFSLSKAVIWENNVLSYLETPPGITSSIATSLNRQGNKIVGYLENASQQTSPALWINKRFVPLPLPVNNLKNAAAHIINADGTLIAGHADFMNANNKVIQQAVLWKSKPSASLNITLENDSSTFEPCLLPMANDYSSQSFPQAIDTSGERIVGYEMLYYPQSDDNSGIRSAVVWIRMPDNQFKSYLLQEQLGLTRTQGHYLKEATCIDSSGTIIGGNGDPCAWWAYLPNFEAFLAEGIPINAFNPERT